MSFTLSQLVWAVRSRKLGITAETSASLVLALAEQQALAPRGLALNKVTLTQSGQLFFAGGVATSARAADQSLRSLLAELLSHCSGDHPALNQCAEGDATGLEVLSAALLKALVPLNRSAAKRGLSRLHRRLQGCEPPAEPDVQLATTPAVVVRPSSEAAHARSVSPSLTSAQGEYFAMTPTLDIVEVEYLDEDPLVPCTEGTPVVQATPRVDARVRAVWAAAYEAAAYAADAYAADAGDEITVPLLREPFAPAPSAPSWLPVPNEPSLASTPHAPVYSQAAAWPLPASAPSSERTPFLGSLNVRACAALEHSSQAQGNTPSATLAPRMPGLHVVPDAPGAADDALIFGRFKAKRSDAGQLIADFALESSVSQRKVAAALRRCAGVRLREGEVSCTPPPVGFLVPLSSR